MQGNFHDPLEQKAQALPSDRSTGLVLASALLIATVVWRAHTPIAASCLTVATLLAGLSLAKPGVLRPLNVAWMGLGHFMGRIVNPIVMFVLFCVTIVPFGIAMQMRRDPLRRRPTEANETFWIVPDTSFGPADLTRQF